MRRIVSTLLFPTACVGCGTRVGRDPIGCGTWAVRDLLPSDPNASRLGRHGAFPVCITCRGLIQSPEPPDVEELLESSDLPSVVMRAAALWFYAEGSVVPALHRHIKYGGGFQLGIACGRLLGRRLRLLDWPLPDAVVPVPLHTARFRERGYNQADTIASGVGAELGRPVDSFALRRARASVSQVGRSRSDRRTAMEGAFIPNPRTPDREHVLLVDDVVTTGATVRAAAKALVRAGCGQISVAALALVRA